MTGLEYVKKEGEKLGYHIVLPSYVGDIPECEDPHLFKDENITTGCA